jgi:RecA/RadA recombinase
VSDSLREELTKERIPKSVIPKEDYLSTGSTLLNLACSGKPDCGLAKGKYFWMAGSSASGKTFLTLTCFAEACKNPNWDDYDLIFDDVEGGALMDFDFYFGSKMAERIQPPRSDEEDGSPIYSEIAEDFYYNLDDRLSAVEKGDAPPFLYLLDSMDALSSKYEQEKFDENKKARRSGKEAKGDYGDGKAKINSRWIRGIVARLRDTKSSLIVLSQVRDNIDGGMFDPRDITSGGRALKFYATWQLWSKPGSKITTSVNGTDRQIGVNCRIAVKKNRLSGKEWTIELPIYHSYGIDDLGSCVDFLIKEKRWKKDRLLVVAPDFDFEGNRYGLIKKIEDENLEFDLKDLVAEVWNEIEAKCRLERKPRYE